MNPKLIELAEQRVAVVARAEAQRAELSQELASWRKPLKVVDQGWAAVRYLGSNPMLLGGVAAFLVALRSWRMVKWLPPGWLTWRLARMALGAMGVIRSR